MVYSNFSRLSRHYYIHCLVWLAYCTSVQLVGGLVLLAAHSQSVTCVNYVRLYLM
jgi:hypothetical protein